MSKTDDAIQTGAPPPPSPSLNVRLNLDVPINSLKLALKALQEHAAFTLSLASGASEAASAVPDSPFQLQVEGPEPRPLSDLKSGAMAWLVASTIRDGLEAVNLFLDEIYLPVATWELLKCTGGKVPKDEFDRVFGRDKAEFHKDPLHKKVASLTKLGFTLPAELKYIESLNVARRCLVHRGGLVTQHDAKALPGIEVRWVALAVRIADESGDRVVDLPYQTAGPATYACVSTERCKTIPLGSRVTFTPRELAEILFCFLLFGMATMDRLVQHAQALGFHINWKPGAEPKDPSGRAA